MNRFKAIGADGKVDMVTMNDHDLKEFKAGNLTPLDFDCFVIFTDPEELEKFIVDLITKK